MEFIFGLIKTWLHIAIGMSLFLVITVFFLTITSELAKYLDRRDERIERESKK